MTYTGTLVLSLVDSHNVLIGSIGPSTSSKPCGKVRGFTRSLVALDRCSSNECHEGQEGEELGGEHGVVYVGLVLVWCCVKQVLSS